MTVREDILLYLSKEKRWRTAYQISICVHAKEKAVRNLLPKMCIAGEIDRERADVFIYRLSPYFV